MITLITSIYIAQVRLIDESVGDTPRGSNKAHPHAVEAEILMPEGRGNLHPRVKEVTPKRSDRDARPQG